MDENHQDNAENKLNSTENKSRMLLSEPEDEKKAQGELAQLRKRISKNEKGAFKSTHNWTGFKGKTLWDWLNLLGVLAIPLVVVGATIAFGIIQADLAQKQHDSDQVIANQQHAADQAIANQQFAADQQSALDQQRATILQTYIDNIQDLLLNHNLLGAKPDDDVAILARARTLNALQGLDISRKGVLLQFLYEAHLIGFVDSEKKQQLSTVNLAGADLSGALLDSADLHGADLRGADLRGAHLTVANLVGANLSGALLDGTYLDNADLSGALLDNADLSGSDVQNANLRGADLRGAHLNTIRLDNANLSGANLSGADLTWATLSGAKVTNEQLAQAKSLQGATMPDGSIHP